jgi:histidine ammonia-lyase
VPPVSGGTRVVLDGRGLDLDGLIRLADATAVPVVPAEAAPDGTGAHHHGGFFAAPLGLALDGLRPAVLQTAQLSRARLAALCGADLTGLPAFLASGPASGSGAVILEYMANSALADLRSYATPAPVGHAVPACELVVAVRALRLHPAPPPVAALTAVATASRPTRRTAR